MLPAELKVAHDDIVRYDAVVTNYFQTPSIDQENLLRSIIWTSLSDPLEPKLE